MSEDGMGLKPPCINGEACFLPEVGGILVPGDNAGPDHVAEGTRKSGRRAGRVERGYDGNIMEEVHHVYGEI